jgi:hypothetical protein
MIHLNQPPLPPIKHTQLFDFPAYQQGIKDISAATTEFGKSVSDTLKRLKTDQKELTVSLEDYARILKTFNTAQTGAADGLKQYSDEIEGTSTRLKELKQVQSGWAQIVNVQKASIAELKAEFAGLKKQYEALRPDQADYAAQVATIQARIKEVTPAINAHTAALRANSAGIKAAEGSYQMMNAQLNELRTQLKTMPNAFDAVTGRLNKNNLEAVQLSKQIQTLDQSLKKMDETMGQHVRNVGHYENAFRGLGTSMLDMGKNLLAAVGFAGGTFALVNFLESSIEKFNEEEQAISRLQNTLRNAGREDLFGKFKEKVKGLHEEFKIFEDEELIEFFGKLITFGKLTERQIDQITPVIINFASKQKISLEEATGVILKAIEGNTRGLREYGINIKNVKTEAERFNVILAELGPRVEGAAAAFGETTQGQIKKTRVEIVELKETIGEKLQPAIKGFYQLIQSVVEGASIGFTNLTNNFNKMLGQITLAKNVVSSFITGGTTGAISTIAAFKTLEDQKAQAAEQAKQRQEAEDFAKSFAENTLKDLEKRGLSEKQITAEMQNQIRSQKALLHASNDTYNSLVAQGKGLTTEGKAALKQFYQDYQIVKNLTEKLAEAGDKRVIGVGGELGGMSEEERLRKLKEAVQKGEDLLAKAAELDIKREELKRVNGEIGELEFQKNKLAIIEEWTKKGIALELSLGKDANKSRIEDLKKNVIEAQIEIDKIRQRRIHEGTTLLRPDLPQINPADTIDDFVKRQKTISDREVEAENLFFETIKAGRQTSFRDEIEHLERIKKARLDHLQDAAKEEIAIERLKADRKKQIEEDTQKFIFDVISTGLQITQQISDSNSEARIANLETEKQRELNLAGNNAAAKEKIEKDYNDRIKKEKRKQAQNDKIFALFNVAISTAQGVAKTIADWGMPFAIPFIAFAIGEGLLQAALIAARPLPQFKKGTGSAPEGWANLGEEGYEFIKRGDKLFMTPNESSYTYLKGGEKIYTHSESKRLLEQSAKAQEAKQLAETAVLHQSLSNQLRKGKEQELVYLYAKAMGQGQNLVNAFKEAVKDIPVFINKWDDRGYHESIRKRNETTNYLNGRHKH